MIVRSSWASSVIDSRGKKGVQIGSEHGADPAVGARVRLRMKTVHLPNWPAKLDMAKLKATVPENLCLQLRKRFKGLDLDDDAFPKNGW